MKKKLVAIISTVLLVGTMSMNVFAAESNSSDIGEIYSIDSNSEQADGINSKQKAAAPKWHWASELHLFGGLSKSYSTNNAETAEYPIDYIEVMCKIYQEDSIYASDFDSGRNSAVASVKMGPYTGLSAVVKREVYGSHIFRHTGYEDMVKESHAY